MKTEDDIRRVLKEINKVFYNEDYNKEALDGANELIKGYHLRIKKYKSALEEISGLASPHCTQCSQIINIINEVL